MTKLEREYRGIEFIRLSDLPEDIRQEIKGWVNDKALLIIKTNEALYRDCILTKDFNYWYKNIYAVEAHREKASRNVVPILQFSN
jgi:hypothetical protein